jgi:predicted HTH transcriptional regulator
MENYLESLIENGEGSQLEFIQNLEPENSIVTILCSFANTDGGSLLIGVKKNGKVVGTEPSESYSIITNLLYNQCQPNIPFEFTVHHFTYKIVIEIIVPKNDEIFMCLDEQENWNSYIRLGKLTLKANSVLKKYIELQKGKKILSKENETEMQEVIQIVSNNPLLSLTQLSKKTSIKRDKIESILALLIHQNKINFDYVDDSIVYLLHSEV